MVSPVFQVDSFDGEPAAHESGALGVVDWFDLAGLPQPLAVATIQAVATMQTERRRPSVRRVPTVPGFTPASGSPHL